jgi:hypothetical protein
MFWFKSNKIVIDAFTTHDMTRELYPIARAAKYMPDFWKDLPANKPGTRFGTLKRCQGFIDLYANSFVLPLWSDLEFNLSMHMGQKVYNWQFADRLSVLGQHEDELFEGFVDPTSIQHFKFVAPWLLKEKTGVKFTTFHPAWNLHNLNCKFVVLPGVMDFKYQHAINVNTMFEFLPEQERRLFFEAGTPIAQYTAHSDRPVEIKCHTVSDDEFKRMFHMTKFCGSYKDRKERINSNESKCPFKAWH